MGRFADHELEFLHANRLSGDRWACFDNARPLLLELTERGLMQPAYGEFKMAARNRESVNLFGQDIPLVGDMISLYTLTSKGREAFSEPAQ